MPVAATGLGRLAAIVRSIAYAAKMCTMPIYQYKCNKCASIIEEFHSIHDSAPDSVVCDDGEVCCRVYGDARFVFDGGRERWHSTTLKQERDRELAGLDRLVARSNGKLHKDMFHWKDHKELV